MLEKKLFQSLQDIVLAQVALWATAASKIVTSRMRSVGCERLGLATRRVRRALLTIGLVIGGDNLVHGQTPPPDASWLADAVVKAPRRVTAENLGAGQGVAIRDGRIYAYGDVYSAQPRVGVIREYDVDLNPTGRAVWLRQADRPLIIHPTGLTWHDRWGTLLGDTIKGKATIYRLDWQRAWADGHLGSAVRDVIDDDAAINGCRPTFVTVNGRVLIATADYGNVHPEIRLYDPELLLKHHRSSTPGVEVYRALYGPFNQNLHWDAESGRLTCVQNVVEGRGWRLDVINLAAAIADGRADAPGVRIKTLTFSPHDELEGYWPLDRERSLFVTSRRDGNIVVGSAHPIPPRISPPGATDLRRTEPRSRAGRTLRAPIAPVLVLRCRTSRGSKSPFALRKVALVEREPTMRTQHRCPSRPDLRPALELPVEQHQNTPVRHAPQ